MRIRKLSRSTVAAALENGLHSASSPNPIPAASRSKLRRDEFVAKLLDRKWALKVPDSEVHKILVSESGLNGESNIFGHLSFQINQQPLLGEAVTDNNQHQQSFYVVRDDLLHPLVNGNKARKLDALLPLLEDNSVTDVVTCGGCQSAHAAAVALSCAERGVKAHLLLRGEQPEILTGYNLISTLYGKVAYVPRFLYAKREEMLLNHATTIAGGSGCILSVKDLVESSVIRHPSREEMFTKGHTSNCLSGKKKIAIINEGAGEAFALLGLIRLVQYLSQKHLFGTNRELRIIIDAGTGTTAVGLGLGAICFGLPWKIIAVMLADTVDKYQQKEESLISEFHHTFGSGVLEEALINANGGAVQWVERSSPRKFGKVLEGEVEACQKVAQQTGILVDPVYTLAAWELATRLIEHAGGSDVVILHTGGTLGIFGLAQRYKSYFQSLNDYHCC